MLPTHACSQAVTYHAQFHVSVDLLETDARFDHHEAADPETPIEWSEEDLVLLHWRLLREIQRLAEPDTPLEEKLDMLRWVFTERQKDAQPFSFVSCLRVVGCSPLAPLPYCGLVDAVEVRDRIRAAVRPWLRETLLRYPGWVSEAVLDHPDWVATPQFWCVDLRCNTRCVARARMPVSFLNALTQLR